MRFVFGLLMGSILFCLAGCGLVGLSVEESGDNYSNRLTVGTGSSGFSLTGETATFSSHPATVYWKLESSADYNGSPVKILVEKRNGSTYEVVTSQNFSSGENKGHYMLSSINLGSAAHYRLTGIIVNTSVSVAACELDVN